MSTNTKKIQALYGLKWNPFAQDIPADAILRNASVQSVLLSNRDVECRWWFCLDHGRKRARKIAYLLRALSDHLSKLPEITVGEIIRPQSGLPDFYREMGTFLGSIFAPVTVGVATGASARNGAIISPRPTHTHSAFARRGPRSAAAGALGTATPLDGEVRLDQPSDRGACRRHEAHPCL